MPAVSFRYTHEVTLILTTYGTVRADQTLTTGGRLYVIRSHQTHRPFYIGTAQNLRQRFEERLRVCRELGFNQGDLNPIVVYVVQIKIDGASAPPDNLGLAGGIDVEHLLIRTYTQRIGAAVRNITKSGQPFVNVNAGLNWSLINVCGITGFGGPYAYHLNANAAI